MGTEESTLGEIAVRVSRYFRDFLESDFKKTQAPRRRIVLTSDTGFRTGMRISPYPSLDRDLWALLGKPSGNGMNLDMVPRKYMRPISAVLRKVIDEQVLAIPETAVVSVRNAVKDRAAATYAKAVENPEAWIEAIQEELAAEIGRQVIRPLIAHLDGPLRQQAYWVMDTLHSAESDLIARVAGDLHRVLPEVLARMLATEDERPLADAVENYLTLEATHCGLMQFFETFVAADAYSEFRDVETYISTSDGMQLYLYLGAIKFRGTQYPLFFLPVQVVRSSDGSGYALEVVNHLFANRRAIDFVLQEVAQGLSRHWISPITERITYIDPQQSIFEVARTLFKRVANAVDLGGQIDLSSTSPDAKTSNVGLSSALYLSAYDRSDEALINDYEEIIDQFNRGGSEVANLFQGLVDGVLMGNERSIRTDVDSEWDSLAMVDRVVFDSPIPLNEEQRKVLLAVRNPQGKIVVVEGPPGTGKSHTITAIAADCAFNKRSCLVLSDKTEALDVVVEKLSEAMSRVRHDRDFPNPILRLGQQNANFKKLTSNATFTQVSSFARAAKANAPRLEAERADTSAKLKSAIERTVETLGAVTMASVQAMHTDESELMERAPEVLAVLQQVTDVKALTELAALRPDLEDLQSYLGSLFAERDFDAPMLRDRLRLDASLADFSKGQRLVGWDLFETLDVQQVRLIQNVLVEYPQLRVFLFGYLFSGDRVRALERQLNSLSTTRPLFLKHDAATLDTLVRGLNALRIKLETEKVGGAFSAAFVKLSRGPIPQSTAAAVMRLVALFDRLSPSIIETLLAQPKDDPILWPLAVRFLERWLATRTAFAEAPQFDYVGTKSKLERLNTSAMNAHVDSRLVKFMDDHRADARALAGVIASRQKFPEEKFECVRESFPVIVASIREFGEFMPLVPDLFDVVVIDEASQVSVAQALPALLRAKKVVVLGDTKQFSNVKSSNASIVLNDKYRSDLVNYFRTNVSDRADALQRLSMFDVKKSILEFCNLGASYSVMLRKHFRSYQELIGYSSRTFYGGQLQAIKIRGVPMDEVIRFDQIVVGDSKVTRGVNEAESQFILEQLLDLLEEEDPPSVGIITPFREQQTHLSKLLFGHTRGRDFEDRLRLKVMTFDSCQGEERNIIMYSMVATPGNDALNYIFPVALDNAQESVEDKLKVQRLNVGFSRAQEMVWFVHSMPLDQYRGSIGQAMAYFSNALTRPDVTPEQTDQSSPMEAKVLGWLQNTSFVQNNSEFVEILPQFPVGEYLKQLDPTYQHPAWRVDFLVTYHSQKGLVHVVIEYDGFEHHFQKGREVHVGNHDRYLLEADVERQLTLESYGYRFLRINRFNLGSDPVATLSARLSQLVKVAGAENVSPAVMLMQQQAEGLTSGELKTCTRCQRISDQAGFYDPALGGGSGGVGRICMKCKGPAGAAPRSRRGFRKRRRA